MRKPNRDTWSLILIMGVFITSGFLAACGSSKSGGDAGTPPGPTYPIDPHCTVNCNPLPPNSKVGFYAQTSNFQTPGYMNAGSQLRIQSGFSSVLRDAMGVCDRNQYSGGYAACSTWLSGAHDLVLLAEGGSQSNTVKLIIRSVPGYMMNGYGWYSYSMPNFKNMLLGMLGFPTGNYAGVYDPMVLESTIWPVNNSQGFEVRANGPRLSYAWNKLFQLQVVNGKMEDSHWDFVLHFHGQRALDGRAVRCQSQNCGLDTSYFNGGTY